MHETKPDELKPRKLPRQRRSILLVEALKEACLRILRSEGTEALTVLRLAGESGVALSSIYEYFPTIESLVAAVLESVRREIVAKHLADLKQRQPPMDLYDYLLLLTRSSIRIRLAMSELHSEIYQHHVRQFDVPIDSLLDIERDVDESGPGVRKVLARYREQIAIVDLDEASLLAVTVLQAATRRIIVESRLYERDPGMDVRIARALFTLLNTP